MAGLSLNKSIITLIVNVLNTPIKKQKLAGWIQNKTKQKKPKHDLSIYPLQKISNIG